MPNLPLLARYTWTKEKQFSMSVPSRPPWIVALRRSTIATQKGYHMPFPKSCVSLGEQCACLYAQHSPVSTVCYLTFRWMFFLYWQAPVAYARLLQVAQGLWSWSSFRECSSTASAKSKTMQKHAPFSCYFQRMLQGLLISTSPPKHPGMCGAFENSCCQVLMKTWRVTQNVLVYHLRHMC